MHSLSSADLKMRGCGGSSSPAVRGNARTERARMARFSDLSGGMSLALFSILEDAGGMNEASS
jgi:hypothetical protein